MKIRVSQLAIACAATSTVYSFVPNPAQAIIATFAGSGPGFSIRDNNPTGACSDIVVPDNLLISDITVSLNSLTHTWIGDVAATLTHIDTNTTVDLFNRVGKSSPGGGGFPSNLNGIYIFNDAFTGDLWFRVGHGR